MWAHVLFSSLEFGIKLTNLRTYRTFLCIMHRIFMIFPLNLTVLVLPVTEKNRGSRSSFTAFSVPLYLQLHVSTCFPCCCIRPARCTNDGTSFFLCVTLAVGQRQFQAQAKRRRTRWRIVRAVKYFPFGTVRTTVCGAAFSTEFSFRPLVCCSPCSSSRNGGNLAKFK